MIKRKRKSKEMVKRKIKSKSRANSMDKRKKQMPFGLWLYREITSISLYTYRTNYQKLPPDIHSCDLLKQLNSP